MNKWHSSSLRRTVYHGDVSGWWLSFSGKTYHPEAEQRGPAAFLFFLLIQRSLRAVGGIFLAGLTLPSISPIKYTDHCHCIQSVRLVSYWLYRWLCQLAAIAAKTGLVG